MSTPAVVDPQNSTPPPAENAVIKQMREQIDSQTKAAKEAQEKAHELETKLKEIERGKLEEIDRLKLEKEDLAKQVADLAPSRDALGRFQNQFKDMFEKGMAAIPEDKREQVSQLVGEGEWDVKYNRLQGALALLGTSGAPRTGTATQPNIPSPPTPATPAPAPKLEPKDWNRINLRDHLPGIDGTAAPANDFPTHVTPQSPGASPQ